MLHCVVLGSDGVPLRRPKGASNTPKPVSRLSDQTGLPSQQTGLQADWRASAGDPTKIHTHPEQARRRRRKPVWQAEMSLSDPQGQNRGPTTAASHTPRSRPAIKLLRGRLLFARSNGALP
ncbi:hypothetical protein K438DRAFT_1753614 [Mycena galopus ATCC 62051]|nr:hypothetical protein K438DRAFT_1753614 [Mycena galopus ATCC 62051]